MTELKIYGLKQQRYQVLIEKKTYQKMMALSEAVAPTEAGGLLVCNINGTKIEIEDLLVPKQTVTGGSVNMDSDTLAKMLEPFVRDNPDLFTKIKGWWHSHGNIEVHWSAGDDDNIRKQVEDADIFVSIVTNASGDLLTRVDKKLNKEIVVGYNDVETLADKFDPDVLTWVNQTKKKIKHDTTYYEKGGKGGLPIQVFGQDIMYGRNPEYGQTQFGDYPYEPPEEEEEDFTVPLKGWKDPEYGYIPRDFIYLNEFSRQVFYQALYKAKKKVSKKQRKKLIKALIEQQEKVEKQAMAQ